MVSQIISMLIISNFKLSCSPTPDIVLRIEVGRMLSCLDITLADNSSPPTTLGQSSPILRSTGNLVGRRVHCQHRLETDVTICCIGFPTSQVAARVADKAKALRKDRRMWQESEAR